MNFNTILGKLLTTNKRIDNLSANDVASYGLNATVINVNVDLNTLSSGNYVSDGITSSAQNYPFTFTISTHSNIIVFGKEGNKVIILVNSYLSSAIYIKIQSAGTWSAWQTYYSYTSTLSNRSATEAPVYYWSANGKQVYSKFLSGTAPTNTTSLIVTPSTGNVSRLISYDGWILKKGTTQRVPINNVIANATDLTNCSPIYQDNTTGSIYLYLNNDTYNAQSFELTVYYTK